MITSLTAEAANIDQKAKTLNYPIAELVFCLQNITLEDILQCYKL